jgi:hypothetical protein
MNSIYSNNCSVSSIKNGIVLVDVLELLSALAVSAVCQDSGEALWR